MAPTIKNDQPTKKEVAFCEFWERVILPRKWQILTTDLDKASNLIGVSRSGNCSACNRNDAQALNNIYQRLRPAYVEYKKPKPVEKPVEIVEPEKDYPAILIVDDKGAGFIEESVNKIIKRKIRRKKKK